MGTCYIVGAGEFYGSFSPLPEDLVIAADGGYDTLRARGIRIDLLLGDLDSISDAQRSVEAIVFPKDKDETDMHLAYLEGKRRGYTSFKLYGGVGGRADHTYANYCLLQFMRENGDFGILYDKESICFVIQNETTRLTGKAGKGFSVFAIGTEASDVSVIGARYELKGGKLSPSFPLGVSNKFLDSPCDITVERGSLLIFQEI
jgi:thiamine pyrophosphokinase